MKIRLSLPAALLLVGFPLFAQHDHGHSHAKPAAADPAMEAMIKAGSPSGAHKLLDPFAGKWNVKVDMWMAPGAPAAASEGTAEERWVMNGRYLEQRFTGNFFGQPFEGLGYTGYDNVKKQYWSTWMDSMSTGMMMTAGAGDGKSFRFTGTTSDPMTGKDAPVEIAINVGSADQYVMEMWGPGPDGKNYKMMEMTYTRRK